MCSYLLFNNVLQRAVCKCMQYLACAPHILTFLGQQILASLCFHSLFHWSSITYTKQVLHQQLKTSSKQCAGLRPTDTVMDLFCGTGSIGLTLAKDCHHVYGFESTASSVADARRNANVNGISNATFVHGDLTKVAAMMGQQYPSPDVIVTGGLFLREPVHKLGNACHVRGCSFCC